MNNLPCNFLYHELSANARLLDVRSDEEHRREALPGALHIPLQNLPLTAKAHINTEEEVLVYCHSDSRAIIAEKILAGMGYKNVVVIGGLQRPISYH